MRELEVINAIAFNNGSNFYESVAYMTRYTHTEPLDGWGSGIVLIHKASNGYGQDLNSPLLSKVRDKLTLSRAALVKADRIEQLIVALAPNHPHQLDDISNYWAYRFETFNCPKTGTRHAIKMIVQGIFDAVNTIGSDMEVLQELERFYNAKLSEFNALKTDLESCLKIIEKLTLKYTNR